MKDIEKIFSNIPQPGDLSGDFESTVFKKINRKKRQRKAAVSFVAGFFFAALLYAGYSRLLVPEKPDTRLIANKTGTLNNSGNVKQEIPLTEDLYLTSSEQNTNYLIEKVSLETEDGSL